MLRKHQDQLIIVIMMCYKLMKKFSYQKTYCVHISHLLEHEGLTEGKNKMAIKQPMTVLKRVLVVTVGVPKG